MKMRIVQLSDIHLSKDNIDNLRNYYIEGLLTDLCSFHETKSIDLILLTGDLVDKGGTSLNIDHCYSIFDKEFITPITNGLNIDRSRILFIPGNHDIDRNLISKEFEYYLASNLNKDMANKMLEQMRDKFDSNNNRIQNFKKFEEAFHVKTKGYLYSNNESLCTVVIGGEKIGIALINDSWRCSADLKSEQHFIGFNQLFNAKKHFQQENTKLNIAVFHHPLELINIDEAEEIETILKTQNFGLALFGHTHFQKSESIVSPHGGTIKINGRAAFNNSSEKMSKFQPGYTIIDINLQEQTCRVYGRKFIHAGYRFDKDVDNFKDGEMEFNLPNTKNVALYKEDVPVMEDLPGGFSTDVNRIVQLLIGKSLYPSSYSFVRELIQNAVDACNRRKESETHATPQITIRINTADNYFEVIDEGDGMTKKVLREHFAVIGKSISQEHNPAQGNIQLISQFGIGFISTFVVAQKVIVSTKSTADERIQFEIKDVFQGFMYTPAPNDNGENIGTTIRVYLKQKFRLDDAISMAIACCRHIDNLTVYLNENKLTLNEDWNIGDAVETIHIKRANYEMKLAIGEQQRTFIASNSGFLIATDQAPLLPYKFPAIIGGEVNFKPRAIDFDLSRTKIIDSEKARDFRRELSTHLKRLFREALDKGNTQMKNLITGYLNHYLSIYDQEKARFAQSYDDFYTEGELIALLLDLLEYKYEGRDRTLRNIIEQLKHKKLNTVYSYPKNGLSEDEKVLLRYLQGQGNFVFIPGNANVAFRGVVYNANNLSALQKIFHASGFTLIQLTSSNTAKTIQLPELSIQEKYPELNKEIALIEKKYAIQIRMVPLGVSERAIIQLGNDYIINIDSMAFAKLASMVKELPPETIFTYLLGLLEVNILPYPTAWS